MSGFSADWLALREPADHCARDVSLLARLAGRFEGAASVTLLDLGCGTGSNLRAMASAFPAGTAQHWRLLDHDPALLDAARRSLAHWADAAIDVDGGLALRKSGRDIRVDFTLADLRDPKAAQAAGTPDIVTAAAFFDLVSPAWIAAFVDAIDGVPAVYATLSYDGVEVWTPPHPADYAMLAAFHVHQRRDKGFGPAAGPDGARVLAEALSAAGYAVQSAQSPWHIGDADRALIAMLAEGSAAAVAELGYFDAQAIEDWRNSRRDAIACFIGHADVLALKG